MDATPEILQRLDTLIQVMSTPRVPLTSQLWTRDDVGAYFKLSQTQLGKVLARPGFPAARYPSGHARYVAGEVMAWAEKQKSRKALP